MALFRARAVLDELIGGLPPRSSHRSHTLHTTLSTTQEAIVLSLRQSLYLPLDDLLYIARQYINPDVSRSSIARSLKREGMARLEDVIPKAGRETISAKKTVKDYEPGFVHKRLPTAVYL
jgi:hypothetical protein